MALKFWREILYVTSHSLLQFSRKNGKFPGTPGKSFSGIHDLAQP